MNPTTDAEHPPRLFGNWMRILSIKGQCHGTRHEASRYRNQHTHSPTPRTARYWNVLDEALPKAQAGP